MRQAFMEESASSDSTIRYRSGVSLSPNDAAELAAYLANTIAEVSAQG